MNDKKIIIVETDAAFAPLLQSCLQSYGFKTLEVVTAKPIAQENEEIVLEASAESFLQKPMIFGKLLMHIQQRLSKDHAEAVLIGIGPFMLDRIANYLVRADGDTIKITEKERDMLLYLQSKAPKSVSRQDLLEAVWGYGDKINTHTLETHIYRLRQKIEKNTSEPEYLLTDEDGYRLEI